jgi:hypothetical protein
MFAVVPSMPVVVAGTVAVARAERLVERHFRAGAVRIDGFVGVLICIDLCLAMRCRGSGAIGANAMPVPRLSRNSRPETDRARRATMRGRVPVGRPLQ